ncbi:MULTISPECIES: hypothetical protein [unclassified Rhizobium]|uniref:hypothetical protein n=1 Tax=unclassified Rhizobium TaxID=2613769 RepID=UPI00160966FB|nr:MULTISPECIES: hypothetical protein [unclassified Rhizobium]MBB3288757.1 hypothetical protein [Rhizobium sp. BK252]MBB3403499.1 hypothetical protein [Rhizobium sp. BK289]MBB3416316.1 hypothetical protein [Rhizobium sp. BK284]MBB3483962.1 hypothetical protein [Rhizobium sp. BK347]
MAAKSSALAKTKPQAKSRIGNGKALLDGVDGRSVLMRRVREILAQLTVDMGGDPSEAKMIIARRATTIAVWCEAQEALLANGNEFDISEFTTATNALRRLLADIGLERKAKDITPTLEKYLSQQYSEAAE